MGDGWEMLDLGLVMTARMRVVDDKGCDGYRSSG